MRKLTHLILIAFIASFSISAVIFVSTLSEKPEDVAIKYFKAIIEQDPDAVYKTLSQKDQRIITKNKLSQILLLSDNPIVKSIGLEIADRIKYKVISKDRNDNNATVKLEMQIQIPDIRNGLEDLLKIFFGPDDTKTKNNKITKKVRLLFKQNKVPYKTVKKQFTLVKEKNQWKITFGNSPIK